MPLTDAEWTVMKVVWERNPVSARDVLEAVEAETSWAYSTVKTILDRLVAKGVLRSRMRANTLLYEPVLSRDKARRSAIRSLVDKAFNGAFGPFMHFLITEEKLSEKEREMLLRLLDKQREDV